MHQVLQYLNQLNSLEVCFIVLMTSFGIQMIYLWLFYARFSLKKFKNIGTNQQAVSVIICAKNEYNNLTNFLPSILNQDYPDYEVVVVNDCSDDDTIFLLKDLSIKFSHLKVVNLYDNVNFFAGKKLALAVGIKSAKNEIILLTDADCKPKSANWINHMQQGFINEKEIVLGYGAYERRNGFLNKLIRYDTLNIALQYFSFALNGMPYMGVGRNLAYKKSLFFKNKGFSSHYKINSGDDDLFINMVATKKNVNIVVNEESHTTSIPKTSFSRWILQKKRHLTTSKYYKFKHKFLISLQWLSKTLFYSLLLFLLIKFYQLEYLVTTFFVYWLSLLTVTKLAMKKLGEKNIWFFALFGDVFFVIFNPLLVILNLFSKKNKWN